MLIPTIQIAPCHREKLTCFIPSLPPVWVPIPAPSSSLKWLPSVFRHYFQGLSSQDVSQVAHVKYTGMRGERDKSMSWENVLHVGGPGSIARNTMVPEALLGATHKHCAGSSSSTIWCEPQTGQSIVVSFQILLFLCIPARACAQLTICVNLSIPVLSVHPSLDPKHIITLWTYWKFNEWRKKFAVNNTKQQPFFLSLV